MREYETIFITQPDGSESQTNQLIQRVDEIIERHGGSVLQHKNWGRKELAYKVQKHTHGVYHYYNYAADSGAVADLERALRLHDLPMKFLTVKISDKVDVEARKKELSQQKAAEEAAAREVAAKEALTEKPSEPEAKAAGEVKGDESVSDEEVKDA